MESNIKFWADLSSIATFIVTSIASLVGIYGYCNYRYQSNRKKRNLEDYLKQEKERSTDDSGQRSLLHLVRHVGLTQEEIIQISFKSKKIRRKVKQNEAGFADSLLFEYAN